MHIVSGDQLSCELLARVHPTLTVCYNQIMTAYQHPSTNGTWAKTLNLTHLLKDTSVVRAKTGHRSQTVHHSTFQCLTRTSHLFFLTS